MRILVTGAHGFIGHHFLLYILNKQGHEVAALTRREGSFLDRVYWIKGDLKELTTYERACIDFHPEAIVHLAWEGVTGSDRNHPIQLNNLTIAANLLQLASKIKISHWIGLGSQAEYGAMAHSIHEGMIGTPTNLYGQTKKALFKLTEQFCARENIRFAWMRLFSAYGPMENSHWLLSYVIRSCLDGIKPKLTGCEQLWDYLFVEDAAEALYEVLVNKEVSGDFNLGSGKVYSLSDIVHQIRDLINPSLSLGIGEIPYREDQVMYLEANISKLTAATGWNPKTSLKEGLEKTIASIKML